jgi:hypothetical protein
MPIPTTEIQRVGDCPHCGNSAPQKLIYVHSYEATSYDMKTGQPSEFGPECDYYIAICPTCNDLLIYHTQLEDVTQTNFVAAELLFPSGVALDSSVPESIRVAYDEAIRIRNIAPNAYAVMLRRALEALCDDRGVTQGDLHTRLQFLVSRGELPSTLSEMTSILRTLGNVGAHNDAHSVTVPMTWGMNNFFRAIVEYVYVAPSKINNFKKRLEATQK